MNANTLNEQDTNSFLAIIYSCLKCRVCPQVLYLSVGQRHNANKTTMASNIFHCT